MNQNTDLGKTLPRRPLKGLQSGLQRGKLLLQQIEKRIEKRLSPFIVGAFTHKKKLHIFMSNSDKKLALLEGNDNEEYQVAPSTLHSTLPSKACRLIQLDSIDKGQFAVMVLQRKGVAISLTKDLKKWSRLFFIGKTSEGQNFNSGVLIPGFQKEGLYVMLLGGKKVQIATSKNALDWDLNYKDVLDIPVSQNEEVHLDFAKKLANGILISYRFINLEDGEIKHRVHMALLDSHDISRILWRTSKSVFESSPDWGSAHFAGAVLYRGQIHSFWNTEGLGTLKVSYSIEDLPFQLTPDHVVAIQRARENPVIYPRPQFSWESFATYNPAAFYARGRIHILYRAQGSDLISSIGYASSKDGVNIDERSESPVYLPQEVFESFQKASPDQVVQKYVSGGGIAGCEDPRVTLIGERLYMTYVAFDGCSPPRAALTSIALEDLLVKKWNWQKPVLISEPGIVNKSAVIFPEKIKGKFVMMYRIFPDIQIDYLDDLNFDGSRWLTEKARIPVRENMWDSRKIGAGAPPLKTAEGWLLIYYGVDDRDDRFYKIGAMLLDLEDPSKVLYRSSTPILEPEDWYENSGFKPGVVYPCGAVLHNEKIFVYYGGADCVVCVASRDLHSFIEALKSNHDIKFSKQKVLRTEAYETHTKSIQPYSFA